MSRVRELVVLSLETWSEVWRRNRYIVSELLGGRDDLKVLYVEPPRPGLRSLHQGIPRRELELVQPGRLWVVRPIEWVPQRLTPLVRPLAGYRLRALAARVGFVDPVLWVNNHSMARDAVATGWPIVYDITDDWLVEGSRIAAQWRATRDDGLLLDRAHTVIVCSPALAHRRGRKREVITIPNGIDLEQFTRETERPLDLPTSPTAVYVGTLHEARLDLALCEQMALDLPDVSFAYVGPDALSELSRRRLLRHPNVHLLGARDHGAVAAYYQHADVVIVPHVLSAFTESLDPIKAREIAAAGTPTVSTAAAGLRDLGPPVRIAGSGDFSAVVRLALSDRGVATQPSADLSWRAAAARFGTVLDAAAGPSGRETAGGSAKTLPRERARPRVGYVVAGRIDGTSGIERYSSELLAALVRRDDVEVVPILAKEDAATNRFQTLAPRVDDLVPIPGRSVLTRSLVERYLLGSILASRDLDLVHATKHILPRRCAVSVITIHDLYVFTRAADYRIGKRLLLPAIYRRSMGEADRLIAVSRAVADDIVGSVRTCVTVDVVPEAPPSGLLSANEEPIPVLADRPFALCVSDLSKRKNFDLLVRIWPEIHARSGHVLAIVGSDRGDERRLGVAIDRLVGTGQAVRAGRISDGELRWCYERAAVVLVPSLEEGFGLPAAEAMAFGAPLITSNARALVELTGPEVPHLSPSDDRAWTETILSVLEQGGHNLPSCVTWDEIAEATVAVYRAALS